MLVIPLQNLPSQEFSVLLNRQQCKIKLFYRFGEMFMDLTVDDILIIKGAVCRNGVSIIQKATDKFVGSLHFYDTLGRAEDPQWDALEDRFELLYVEDDDYLPFDLAH